MNKKYSIEAEYKFLVDKLPYDYDRKELITQFYFDKESKKDLIKKVFALSEEEFLELSTARIRVYECEERTRYILTVKSKGGFSRKEYEKDIPLDLFEEFKKGKIFSIIVKNRYCVFKEYNHKNYCFEFDEYLNLKEKMYTCEIEINPNEEKELTSIKLQELLQKYFKIKAIDVTNDYRYKNSNLHKYF